MFHTGSLIHLHADVILLVNRYKLYIKHYDDTLDEYYQALKISIFILRIKLNVFRSSQILDCMIKDIIKRNYNEIYIKYINNNNDIKGIKNQYLHPTIDYINAIKSYGIDNKYFQYK